MSRMDKYNEQDEENNDLEEENHVLSRVGKNQTLYDDVYLNSSVVDSINNVMGEDKEENDVKEEEYTYQEETYEEKSYDINEYLMKAHENSTPDDKKRDINNNEFKEQEYEIRKLIASIDEKEEKEDFFSDLKGDDEDTLIGAKFKTDEFNDSIYETLKGDSQFDGNTVLEHALGDNTVVNLEKEEDSKMDHTFEEILKSDTKKKKKSSTLPIVIFSITTFILIVVIIIILIK